MPAPMRLAPTPPPQGVRGLFSPDQFNRPRRASQSRKVAGGHDASRCLPTTARLLQPSKRRLRAGAPGGTQSDRYSTRKAFHRMSRLFTVLFIGMACGVVMAQPASPVTAVAPAAPDALALARFAESPAGRCMKEAPEYPVRARQHGVQGTALAAFAVLPDGSFAEAGLQKSTGHELLDFHARRHIRRCIEMHRGQVTDPPLRPGTYAFPIEWRLH